MLLRLGDADGAEQMLQAALTLLTDLKKLFAAGTEGQALCVRRITEAEAASEPALVLIPNTRILLAVNSEPVRKSLIV